MRHALLAISIFALALPACSGSSRARGPNHGGSNPDGAVGPGSMNIPNCDPTNAPADGDQDQDGYTPAMGDCNDCNPSINPGAIQIPGDPTDYACNGMPGVVAACDSANTGMHDPTSLAEAFEQCDPRFFKSATMVGPSDQRARKVVATFGVLMPRMGKNMALVSSGIAADKSDPDFDKTNEEDPGTDLSDSNTYANPDPSLMGIMGCGQSQPSMVNDYTELVVKLHAPTNVNSFSFDFQFFSAEYPVYVCTEFNDEFLVMQESKGEFAAPTNIAFDMQKNPITINNGFFTVCTNDTSKPQTQNCKHPVTDINGTGFEDPPGAGGGGSIPCQTDADCFGIGSCTGGMCNIGGGGGNIPGGSTGWLTTTAGVTPGEDVTLHFIVFDEGDHILDSAALIDNFRWGTSVVSTPSTMPIQ
ncbi:MAG: choice-of-anchor L domain-containing protein [Polyangia bacterium]|jgi:hypothetical protein